MPAGGSPLRRLQGPAVRLVARSRGACPSLVQASFHLDAQTGIRAGDEAPEHPLDPLEEPDAVQQQFSYPHGDAVIGVVGALVVDVVVLLGEYHPIPLEPDSEGRWWLRVRPLVELVCR